MTSPNIRYRHVSFAIAYRTVLFPFDSVQFIRILPKHGWVLTEQIEGLPLASGRLEVNGKVGGKGIDLSVRLNTERKILSVDAPDPRTAAVEFNNLERALESDLDVDSGAMAMFYEFLADANVKGRKDPLETWFQASPTFGLLPGLAKAIRQESMPFGIRLSQARREPNQPDWFEIRFEPSVQMPHTNYWTETVFRRQDRKEVAEFSNRFEEMLQEMVSVLEGTAT